MSESALRNAFRDIASGVRPEPEPYARLMARSRRRRFSHWLTGVTAAIAALVIAPVALNAADEPKPDLGPIENHVLLISPWTRKLIDGPAVGTLAGDKKFTDEVAQAVRVMDVGEMRGYPVKVLFAQDVGDRRVVIAVRHNKTHQVGVMMSAPRGAVASVLADRANPAMRIASLSSFTSVEFALGVGQELTQTGVALAPPGCVIATAPKNPADSLWTQAPAGRYLVWSDPVDDQLARVTCDGVNRFQGALLNMDTLVRVTGELDLTALRMLGPDSATMPPHLLLLMLGNAYPPRSIGPLRLLHAGPVAGLPSPVYALADQVAAGVWRLQIHTGDGLLLLTVVNDVTASRAVVAVDVPDMAGRVIVMAPDDAVKVEIRDKDTQQLLQTVPLVGGTASVASWGAEEVTLHAFDAQGGDAGQGVAPLESAPSAFRQEFPPAQENWT